MARRTATNCWFVSVEKPKQRRRAHAFARQTKTFPTETEAKLYAKEMVSDANKIIRAHCLAHQPAIRIISGSQLYRWIEEGESEDPA
jgi:hypothetical protein